MRSLVLLLVSATMLNAQEPQVAPEPMRATIRAVDSTRSPEIEIAIDGHLLQSFSLMKGTIGTLSLARDKGKAKGAVVAELSDRPGELVFSSGLFGPQLELQVWPESGAEVPRLHARGRTVRVTREASGKLSVTAGPR